MDYIVGKALKVIIIVLILEVVLINISAPVKAAGIIDDMFSGAENFAQEGRNQAIKDDTATDEEISEVITILYNIVLTLGTIIAIAVGGVLGIKFMISSAEDKAKVKESMIPYVVGCIAIFGALMIWKVVIGILSKI